MAGSQPHVRERLVALAAVACGVLIATGAFLPWLSLFAGLHPLRGVIGLNGRLLAAGGVVCLVAGVCYWRRPTPGLRRAVAVVGLVLAGFSIWLTAQLLLTYRELRANPMLVPQLGPGLFLALAGSMLAGATAALGAEPSRGANVTGSRDRTSGPRSLRSHSSHRPSSRVQRYLVKGRGSLLLRLSAFARHRPLRPDAFIPPSRRGENHAPQ
jgi:hypothetical protein